MSVQLHRLAATTRVLPSYSPIDGSGTSRTLTLLISSTTSAFVAGQIPFNWKLGNPAARAGLALSRPTADVAWYNNRPVPISRPIVR